MECEFRRNTAGSNGSAITMKTDTAGSPEYSVCLVYGHLDLECFPVFLRLKVWCSG